MSSTATLTDSIKNDRILNTYKVIDSKDICFDASGFFSPIAIRDQIIRVCLIIERAKSCGIISADRPLLVIGGGVAGITAVLKASEMNIPVVLVEMRLMFNVLRESIRYFCPIQYDWAVEHWDLGVFPWNNTESIPVIIEEGSIIKTIEVLKEIALEVDKNFYDKIYENVKMESFEINLTDTNEFPFLTINEFLKCPTDETPEDKIKLPDITKFGMGLSCVGFGKERVSIEGSNFRGYEFWTLSEHSNILTDGSLLLCGSGDGTLQDFLLFTTQTKTAKEIYQFLKRDDFGAEEKDKSQEIKSLFENLERNIRFAEEEAKRDELWENNKKIPGKKRLCQIYTKLHKKHLKEADKLLNSEIILKRLKEIVVDEAIKEKIKMSYSCDHFSGCYPLNRFLALLIGRYIDKGKESSESVFWEKTSVIKIVSNDNSHICKANTENSADDCANYPHKVYFAKNFVCENTKEDKPEFSKVYRRIIIRYGISSTKAVFEKEPNMTGLQLLPYTLP
jgi:hypothetical protein